MTWRSRRGVEWCVALAIACDRSEPVEATTQDAAEPAVDVSAPAATPPTPPSVATKSEAQAATVEAKPTPSAPVVQAPDDEDDFDALAARLTKGLVSDDPSKEGFAKLKA